MESKIKCKTGCGEFVKDGSIYCEQHSCVTCNKLVYNNNNQRCRAHTCIFDFCNHPVANRNYCDELHRCKFEDSNSKRCCMHRKKNSLYCYTHRCKYDDCTAFVLNKEYCEKHTCSLANCVDCINNDDVDTCVRHYCTKYMGCNDTNAYCVSHMCTGHRGYKRTLPFILIDDVFSESGCPVHACTSCNKNRMPEHFGKNEGYCKKCFKMIV